MKTRFRKRIASSALLALLWVGGNAAVASEAQSNATATTMDVYKSPTCGCCTGWIEHAQRAGIRVQTHQSENLNAIKQRFNIEPRYQSCHTAVAKQGFVFEGHVPARFIQQFLANPPQGAIGLAVPGMPLGSPGMEAGDRFTPYQVLLLKADGSSSIFAGVATSGDQ